ncbi:MAG: hypothetical protein LKJ76_05925 [Lachnospiraceae bacterium]|jgi:hypothetical protein|nr:hypothetical protein [Lachnospiraceae bacterium]
MAVFDEINQQRKNVQKKGKKAFFSWLWTYYKLPALAVILAVAMVVGIVRSIVTSKPQTFGLLMLNTENQDKSNDTAWLEEPLAKAAGVDLTKNSMLIDLTDYLSPGTAQSTQEMAVSEKIVTYVAAKSVDVLGADAYNFTYEASGGVFMDLKEALTPEQYKKYEPYFFYIDQSMIDGRTASSDQNADPDAWRKGTILEITDSAKAYAAEARGTFESPDPSTMKNPVAVGIILTDAPYFGSTDLYQSAVPVVGIVTNTAHLDIAQKAIDYLWDGSQE